MKSYEELFREPPFIQDPPLMSAQGGMFRRRRPYALALEKKEAQCFKARYSRPDKWTIGGDGVGYFRYGSHERFRIASDERVYAIERSNGGLYLCCRSAPLRKRLAVEILELVAAMQLQSRPNDL